MNTSLKLWLPLMLLLPYSAMAQEVNPSFVNDSTKRRVSEVMTMQPIDIVHGDSIRKSGLIENTTFANSNETFGQSPDFIQSINTALPTEQNDSLSFNLSRTQLTESERQKIVLQGYATQERMLNVPDMVGWHQGGTIANIGKLSIEGYREREEHPNLLTAQRLNVDVSYSTGNLSFTMGGAVNQYYSIGVVTQYGIHGSLSYRFSPNVSATLFGDYYSRNPWFYMATFPYVNTTLYGGFVTIQGNKVGTHLGVERYYDPFVRRWEMRPIVTPYFRISKKVLIELPVGGLLKGGVDRLVHGKRNNGPMMVPKGF